MRIALSADERTGVVDLIEPALRRRGHEVITFGALAEGAPSPWAWCSTEAASAVVAGDADQAIVCCWTGTGASIAANKVPGVRAALCADGATAAWARRWNDAIRPRALTAPVERGRPGGDPRRLVRDGAQRRRG